MKYPLLHHHASFKFWGNCQIIATAPYGVDFKEVPNSGCQISVCVYWMEDNE
jgi:hypothetical protein